MLNKSTLLGIFSLLIIIAQPLCAKDVALNEVRFPISWWSTRLLSIIDVGPTLLGSDVEFVVPAYLPNDAAETKKELEYLLDIAKVERTEENKARIQHENSGMRVFEIFKNEGLIPEENYEALTLLNMIDNDFVYFTLYFKKHFSRPRPSQLMKEVTGQDFELLIENPGHASYPSGHAGQTYVVALFLGELDPKNADVYKQFSIDVAHRREIAGVHYPSDSEAGRQLARDFFEVLRQIPAFEKKMIKAKQSFIAPSEDVIDSVKAYKRIYEL